MSRPVEQKITGDTTVAEVMEIPGALEVLTKYGLPCIHCPMAAFEIGQLKIGEVSKAYGLNGEELIKELNKVLKSEKGGK